MLSSFVSRMFVFPPVDPSLNQEEKRIAIENVIQVNILNGCGESGIAHKSRVYLRARGFDVVEIGNYSTSSQESFVIDRVGDTESAKKVAYALGINEKNIVTRIDSSLFLRSTVVLGNDFNQLKPFE